jgi:hypothetical protein
MYAIPTLCGTQHFVEAHTRGENRMEIKYAANAEGNNLDIISGRE